METDFKQEWFEMAETRKRDLDKAVWIPLRASKEIQRVGSYGDRGHINDFFGAGSVAVSVEQRAEANKLGWDELGLMRDHGPDAEKGKYIPSDVYTSFGGKLTGVPLVLSQPGNMDEYNEWHLHPDLAITLELKRNGDRWFAMNEGYVEVVRLHRDSDGKPERLRPIHQLQGTPIVKETGCLSRNKSRKNCAIPLTIFNLRRDRVPIGSVESNIPTEIPTKCREKRAWPIVHLSLGHSSLRMVQRYTHVSKGISGDPQSSSWAWAA